MENHHQIYIMHDIKFKPRKGAIVNAALKNSTLVKPAKYDGKHFIDLQTSERLTIVRWGNLPKHPRTI